MGSVRSIKNDHVVISRGSADPLRPSRSYYARWKPSRTCYQNEFPATKCDGSQPRGDIWPVTYISVPGYGNQ